MIERIGAAPGDTLAGADWYSRALLAMADDVLRDPRLNDRQRRLEFLKLVNATGKVRDLTRIYQAEKAAKNAGVELGKTKRGPTATEAAPSEVAGVTPRRGRPPRGGL